MFIVALPLHNFETNVVGDAAKGVTGTLIISSSIPNSRVFLVTAYILYGIHLYYWAFKRILYNKIVIQQQGIGTECFFFLRLEGFIFIFCLHLKKKIFTSIILNSSIWAVLFSPSFSITLSLSLYLTGHQSPSLISVKTFFSFLSLICKDGCSISIRNEIFYTQMISLVHHY